MAEQEVAVLAEAECVAIHQPFPLDQLELAGGPFKTNPEGIAIDPKNGDVLKAVQQAMLAIYQDGSYRQILTKWNLLDGEIPVSQIVVSPSPTTS